MKVNVVMDFDADFGPHPISKKDRATIVKYLSEKYGRDHVAYIGNKLFYKPKSVIRDLGQVFDISSTDTFGCSKQWDESMSVDGNIVHNKDIDSYFKKYPKLKRYIPQIVDTMSALGTHAGGIIISDRNYPLSKWCGLQKPHGDGTLSSAWDKKEVEMAGLIKYDFLHITAASIIHYAKELIGLDPYKWILDDDPEVFENTAHKGFHQNIFQFEGGLGKKAFNELKPDSISELSNASGLIRVQGSEVGQQLYEQYKKNVIDAKEGKDKWKKRLRKEVYNDENYEICCDILEETFGILIYQEQFDALIEELSRGKTSFTGGDIIRRELEDLSDRYGRLGTLQGNKKSLKLWHDGFIKLLHKPLLKYLKEDSYKSKDKSIVNFLKFKLTEDNYLEIPKRGIIRWFITSSTYLFSKLHSTAYSINTYQQLWLKYYAPLEFWLASFICKHNVQKMLNVFERAAKSEFNLMILPPNVNESNYFFKIEDENLRYGFGSMMKLDKAGREIEEVRGDKPFKDIDDFFNRVNTRIINKGVVENLLYVGAFDEFGKLEENYDKILKYKTLDKLVTNEKELRRKEVKILGFNIKYLGKKLTKKEKLECTPMCDLEDGDVAKVGVYINNITKSKDRNGNDFLAYSAKCVHYDDNYRIGDWTRNTTRDLGFEPGDERKFFVKRNGEFYNVVSALSNRPKLRSKIKKILKS